MDPTETLFEQVYETYGPSLYRFCLLQMKNPADAEDVLQDVLIKRLYQAPRFKSPEHERNWLFQVALNLCRDEWRRHRRSELPLETVAGVALPRRSCPCWSRPPACPKNSAPPCISTTTRGTPSGRSRGCWA